MDGFQVLSVFGAEQELLEWVVEVIWGQAAKESFRHFSHLREKYFSQKQR